MQKKMHENELQIDAKLVQQLLQSQCSQWANLPLKAILSSGTDNALFQLGNEYVVRLPRIEWEPGSINESIDKEYEWVPKIARLLKVSLSEPLFKGQADQFYPWSWTITKWNEGYNPPFEKENEYEQLAKDLAYFLNDLHSIALANGPFSRRGLPLKEQDSEVRKAMSELKTEIDVQSAIHLWDYFLNIPLWDKAPVWVHGDFLPGNILIENNRLNAVIDFSDVGIGDPACDLIIAWSLFNSKSRKVFREHLKNIDHATSIQWIGRRWISIKNLVFTLNLSEKVMQIIQLFIFYVKN